MIAALALTLSLVLLGPSAPAFGWGSEANELAPRVSSTFAYDGGQYAYDRPPALAASLDSGQMRGYDGPANLTQVRTGALASVLAAKAVGVAGRRNPADIRFSQDSIRSTFRDGRSIDDLAKGLRIGRIDPGDVPPIRLVEREGLVFTLDNRRLAAFQQAGVDVPYRWATADEIASEAYKFTTRNAGLSIRIRGG